MAAGELIYLASPYSHTEAAVVEERFEAVCREAARLMADGHHIYSPIAHTHPIAMRGALPTDWTYWQAYDEAIISRCSELWVLMLPGWEISRGVRAELEIADALGIPIKHVAPATEQTVSENTNLTDPPNPIPASESDVEGSPDSEVKQ